MDKKFIRNLYESELDEYKKNMKKSYCEYCRKIGNRIKSDKLSVEHRQKISASAKGRFWINNGVMQKQIHEDIKSIYLDDEWVLGKLKGK